MMTKTNAFTDRLSRVAALLRDRSDKKPLTKPKAPTSWGSAMRR